MKHIGLLLGCLILIASSAMAQARTKAVAPQLVAQPIRVNTPAITGRRSWVGQPVVQVENISTKPIQYLMIEATLPGAKAPFMLAFGQARAASLVSGPKHSYAATRDSKSRTSYFEKSVPSAVADGTDR